MHCLWCRWGLRIKPRRLPAAPLSLGRYGTRDIFLVTPPASYRTQAYLEAAIRMGCRTRIISAGEHSLVPEIAGGVQVPLDDTDEAVRIVLADAQARNVRAVVGTDDSTVELASRIAAALDLKHNPVAASRAARRKDESRAALAGAGCTVPPFRVLDTSVDLAPQVHKLEYPVVLKPVALSGSRGVIRVDEVAGALAACRRIGAIASKALDPDSRRWILAEQYIEGPEVAVEGLLAAGRLTILAVFDKPDPLVGPYFEETLYVTPSRLPAHLLLAVERELEKACEVFGLREGPVHAEFRLGGGAPWILEVAARTIGGDCARLFQFGTGKALEQLVLANALGEDYCVPDMKKPVGVLMLPTSKAGTLRRVEGVMAARKVAGIEDVVLAVREGYELVPLPEGSSYLGFVFASGDSAAVVEAALREAHAKLNVVVAPAWKAETGTVRAWG